jgi:hypothetical protein
MPLNKTWPAFEIATRQGCLAPSSGDRVGADLFAPEGILEALGQLRHFGIEPARPLGPVVCA